MSDIKITVTKYLTVRGKGDHLAVLSYINGAGLRYVEEREDGSFTAILAVSVQGTPSFGDSAAEVVANLESRLANLESRLDYLLSYSVDRLASGLYAAVITDEPDMDAR